jgi:hypothetical protein
MWSRVTTEDHVPPHALFWWALNAVRSTSKRDPLIIFRFRQWLEQGNATEVAPRFIKGTSVRRSFKQIPQNSLLESAICH